MEGGVDVQDVGESPQNVETPLAIVPVTAPLGAAQNLPDMRRTKKKKRLRLEFCACVAREGTVACGPQR